MRELIPNIMQSLSAFLSSIWFLYVFNVFHWNLYVSLRGLYLDFNYLDESFLREVFYQEFPLLAPSNLRDVQKYGIPLTVLMLVSNALNLLFY